MNLGLSIGITGNRLRGGLGPELITVAADREFSTDTGFWLIDDPAEVEITGGVLSFDSSPIYHGAIRPLMIIGHNYRVVFSIVSLSSGSFLVGTFGAPENSAVYTETGTDIVFDFTAGDETFLRFAANTSATIGTIDNVSLKEIL